MARKDGFIRLVQKRMPQGATPSVPLSDDHTDGTWTYKDLYDGEISINDTGEFYYRSLDTIYQLGSGTGSGTTGATGATGATGVTGATGSQGYRAVMNLSYTGSSLTLGTGTITLPIGVPINNLGWQQGTRVRVWNDATHYMEGQITSVIANPQTTGINVNIDYVVGSGSFGVWYVGIAGDTGSGSGGSQTLADTLDLGNTSGPNDIIFATGYGLYFNNTSRLREGTIDAGYGGNKGIAQICSIGYEMKWESGSLYIMDSNGTQIREVRYTFGATPSIADDITKGFTINSRWVLDNGDIYTCSDNSTGAAIWDLEIITQTLAQTLVVGNETLNNDIILSNSTFTGDSDSIRAAGNTFADGKFSFEDYGGGAWAPTIRTQNGTTTNYITVGDSETYIHNSQVDAFYDTYGQIQVGPTQITTSLNDLANGEGTAFVMTSTSIVVGNQGTTPNVFPGIEYDIDYSANFTNRSLVDKEYVDNVAAGGSGITYSGSTDYVTFFDSDDSLSYTSMHYNSGRYTIGWGAGWAYDNIATLGVYTPYTTGPAVVAEGSQFGGLFIASGANGGQNIGLQTQATNGQISGNLGFYSLADGTASNNIGGYFVASGGTIYPGYAGYSNLGIEIYVDSSTNTGVGVTNSGINVFVTGRGGDNNYIGQLRDGSEGAGKVLTCIDGTGLATWQTPTPSGGGGTVSQIVTQVRNQSGATIHRGKVVYISGSTGTLPLITLSQADTEANSARTYGIVRDDISNNGTGYVVAIGSIQNLDTRTTATNPFTSDTLADGNRLYLSPTTAGYVTNVKPVAPNHIVYIGTVVRTSPTQGYIEYQIQNGSELDELSDVLITTTPTNGQVLAYESATSLWKPTTVSGATPNLTQVLTQGNTASTDIDMNQYQIQNVSVIDADGNVGIHTINMINASLITLMYNT